MTPTQPKLFLSDVRDGAYDAAMSALYRHNLAATGKADRRLVSVTATDPGTGEVIGGLWGRTDLGLLYLELFYLPDKMRGQGLGGQMLIQVEQEAVRRGCRHAVVESSSFQAPDFYIRHGYAEFGRIPFAVAGHDRVFLRKQLGLPKG